MLHEDVGGGSNLKKIFFNEIKIKNILKETKENKGKTFDWIQDGGVEGKSYLGPLIKWVLNLNIKFMFSNNLASVFLGYEMALRSRRIMPLFAGETRRRISERPPTA